MSPRQRQLLTSPFSLQTGRLDDSPGSSSQGVIEEDEDEDDGQEWGLQKGMSLFEVSAKDDLGWCHGCVLIDYLCLIVSAGVKALFDSVVTAIVERENERKRLTLTDSLRSAASPHSSSYCVFNVDCSLSGTNHHFASIPFTFAFGWGF